MPTHKVFRLHSRTDFRAIKSHEEEIPTPDKHEVLIKVKSVSLNYRDVGVANGGYPFPVKDMVVPCSDACGEVVELGSAVKNVEKGDLVVCTFDPTNLYGPQKDWQNGLGGPVDGVLREHVAVPAAAVIKLPSGSDVSTASWASTVCTGVTAWNCLYGNTPLRPGQTVLLQGTGGVSMTALQIAKNAGATTIITSSSDKKLESVKREFGVDHTINYKTADWAEEARRLTNGHGVDYIIENGGSGTIKQSLNAIAMGGNISVVGFLSAAAQEDMPDVAGLALSKGCVVRGITVGSTQLLEEAVRFFGSRKIGVPVDKVFGSSQEEVIKAFEYLTGGSHIGKVCISFEK
ncbi:NAD(P)-binding protein [Aureobasidium subglaciale]|nr:NAD(P)-binding protein [Aureobasidium subglaciale]